jgi:hypothetical protein
MACATKAGWVAAITFVLACGDSGDGDETAVSPTTDTGSSTASTDATSTSSSSTGTDTDSCPTPAEGCPCAPGNSCDGDLTCEAGICVGPATTDDTTGPSGPAECGNGIAEAGELCLGRSMPLTMQAGTIDVTLVDLDDNGHLDVITANRDANNVSVRPGSGSGTFGVQATYPTPPSPVAIGHGHFDDDQHVDVVTANLVADLTDGSVTLFLGSAGGTLQNEGSFDVGMEPSGLAVADLDGNGRDDLVVANRLDGTVHILRSSPAPFVVSAAQTVGSALAGPAAVVLADYANNGIPDIVTANRDGNTLSLKLGNGMAGFGPPEVYMAGTTPSGVGAGDFNGDGLTDVAVVSVSGMLNVRLGDGAGGFGGGIPYPAGSSPEAVVIADLDNDGLFDAAVASSGDDTVRILLGNGSGGFAEAVSIAVGATPVAIAVGDLNEDGLLDIVTANLGAGSISIILTDA